MPKKGEHGEPFAIQVLPDGSERIVDNMGGFSNSYLHPGAAKRLVTCANALDGIEPAKLAAFIEAARKMRSSVSDTYVTFFARDFDAAYRDLMGGKDER